MGKPVQRLTFGAIEGFHRLPAETGGVDVMSLGERPAMVTVEVMLNAIALGRRQIESGSVKDMPRAQTVGGFGNLFAEPTPRAQAAQDLLPAERPAKACDHVARCHMELGKPAYLRANAFNNHAELLKRCREIGGRARPGARIARIAEDASDRHAIKAQRTGSDVRDTVHREHGTSGTIERPVINL
jgi:hypothetical protein